MKTKLDVKKLSTIQKIVDLAKKGVSDLDITKETGVSYNRVSTIRCFFGITRRRAMIDIREDWKMIGENTNRIDFGISAFVLDFDLDPDKLYMFKAIESDNKARTLTIKIKERD